MRGGCVSSTERVCPECDEGICFAHFGALRSTKSAKSVYQPLELLERFTTKDPEVADFLSADEFHFLTCWLIDERARLQAAPARPDYQELIFKAASMARTAVMQATREPYRADELGDAISRRIRALLPTQHVDKACTCGTGCGQHEPGCEAK